ncbi:MAG TPA: adenylosuccinate synthetase, partial [Flavitalea sp.]|nr:adenylosuccinate synthetase [Flavitalea sp.]
TELHDATGEELRKIGHEFGATTGRPRRCGWIDLVALRFACMINGVTKIIMTKSDVLDAFRELNVCDSYVVNGEKTAQVPFQMHKLDIKPEWRSFPGWNTDITAIRSFGELPVQMKEYVDFINNYLGVKISFISNGPGREQLITV